MWLFGLFLLVPLIEIALFVQVGGLIGLWPTLAIVIMTAIAGTWLVRRQGAEAIARLRGSLADLRDPTEPLAHGALILVSGVLLLTPGFFTDAVGFLLLAPAVRAAVLRWLARRVRVETFTYGSAPQRPQEPPRRGPEVRGPTRGGAARGEVIEGEWEELPGGKRPTHGGSNWTRH